MIKQVLALTHEALRDTRQIYAILTCLRRRCRQIPVSEHYTVMTLVTAYADWDLDSMLMADPSTPVT